MKPVFSRRLAWQAEANRISRALADKRSAGFPLLDLTETNPTAAGFLYSDADLQAAFQRPGISTYVPEAAGMRSAREIVAALHDVDPDQVLLTASTSEAYSYLFKLLCDAGDELLAPRPSYPLFEYLAALECVRVVQYPMFYDHGWHVDRAALESLLTPRVRAVVIVNPNNPTGSYVSPGDLEMLRSLGLPIISDEVFAEYFFAVRPPVLAGDYNLSGLSKLCGLPQMKLGWIIARPREAIARLELIADTFLSVGTPVQMALPGLLAAGADVRRQIRQRTARNLAALRTAVRGAAVKLLEPEGGWSAVIQVPATRTEEEWVLHLLEKGLLVQPGFYFDFEREAFLVLSLLPPETTFARGIDILIQETQ